jgi:hypothetical protein
LRRAKAHGGALRNQRESKGPWWNIFANPKQLDHGPFDHVKVDRRGLIYSFDRNRGIDILELAR